MTRPRLALYKSPETSRSNSDCDVTSPSHVTVADSHCHLQVPEPSFVGSSRRSSLFSNSSQKKKKVIVKKPLDTKLRPGWNAPTPKPKRAPYQPFKDWKTGSWQRIVAISTKVLIEIHIDITRNLPVYVVCGGCVIITVYTYFFVLENCKWTAVAFVTKERGFFSL